MREITTCIFLVIALAAFSQLPDYSLNNLLADGKNKITVNAAGQYGVIAPNGTHLIPSVYSKIIEHPSGLIVFKVNKSNGMDRSYSLGFYNKQFKLVLPCQFNSLLPIEDGLIIASQNKDRKFGLVDTLGRIIIPFEYEELIFPSEGLFLAKKNGKYGFINKRNHVVIDFDFHYASPFSEGLAAASSGKLLGYINKKGNWIISEQFTAADEFKYGYASVYFGEFATAIDRLGTVLFPPIFEAIHPVGNDQFIFEANHHLQASITNLLKTLPIILNLEDMHVLDTISQLDEEEDWEFEGIRETFMGIIQSDKQMIGEYHFQQVILIHSEPTKQIYAVQRTDEHQLDEASYFFALMDGSGKLLTDYRFYDVRPEDHIVVEDSDSGQEEYRVNLDGTLEKVKSTIQK